MAALPGIPQQFAVQTSNQQILASWSLSPGATSYVVQRSLDNITFTTIATVSGSPLATQYLDTAVVLSTQYWYKVTAINANGAGPSTNALAAIPAPTGEMTLSQIRLSAQQRADRVNSQFVGDPEWRGYINQAMFELYDLLTNTYEDYFLATPIQFTSDGQTYLYPLPNGSNTFSNALDQTTLTPAPFYKMRGVDLALTNSPNGYVNIQRFNFTDRNKFVYPNTASTIYGVFNMQYRVMGSNVEFVPTPAAGQRIRLWYIPRLQELLLDTDTTSIGISGWIEYVIVKAAYYALTKEESPTESLVMQLAALEKRIEESASNRDAGSPDTIADARQAGMDGGFRGSGSIGGF